jgi:hypothetical protein
MAFDPAGYLSCERITAGFSPTVPEPSCTKTLCNWCFGAYFEREADSPKLLKTLKTDGKDGVFGVLERACKAAAHNGYTIGGVFLGEPLPSKHELCQKGSPVQINPLQPKFLLFQ